jgi:hypothetical protein
MNDANYAEASPRTVRNHRIASTIVFLLLAWLQISGLAIGSVRFIAAQLLAVGFIWLDEHFYYDRLLKRFVAHRTVAWLALVGIHPMIWLSRQTFKVIFP